MYVCGEGVMLVCRTHSGDYGGGGVCRTGDFPNFKIVS